MPPVLPSPAPLQVQKACVQYLVEDLGRCYHQARRQELMDLAEQQQLQLVLQKYRQAQQLVARSGRVYGEFTRSHPPVPLPPNRSMSDFLLQGQPPD